MFEYAKDENLIDVNSLDVEHIVSKTFRFARELANINENLVSLGRCLDVPYRVLIFLNIIKMNLMLKA